MADNGLGAGSTVAVGSRRSLLAPLESSIARKPKMAALGIAALSAVAVVAIIYWVKNRQKLMKSGMQCRQAGQLVPVGNLSVTGMSPLPFRGSVNAGMYGSMDAPPTDIQMAADSPNLRQGALFARARKIARARSAARKMARAASPGAIPAGAQVEGFYASPCKPGDVLVDDPNGAMGADGKVMQVCATPAEIGQLSRDTILDNDDDDDDDNACPETEDCGKKWDLAATMDLQAQAAMGNVSDSVSAEGAGGKRLLAAIRGIEDEPAGGGLSKAQLAHLAQTGQSM